MTIVLNRRVLRNILAALGVGAAVWWMRRRLPGLPRCASLAARYLSGREGIQRVDLPLSTDGSRIRLFVNGDEALPALQEAIAAARDSIRWQVMLFSPDSAGMSLGRLLADAARRGVQVQLSFDLDQAVNGTIAGRPTRQERVKRQAAMDDMLELMRHAGVDVRSNAHGIPHMRVEMRRETRAAIARMRENTCVPANHYDHRKLIIIDDAVAFVGGMNVGDHYLYPRPSSQQHWLDTVTRIEGPVIRQIAEEFDWKWEALGGTVLREAEPPAPLPGGVPIQFLHQQPGQPQIGTRFFQLVENARQEIFAAYPFVSYRPALAALSAAARRGVRVHFVTPRRSQVTGVSRWVFEGSAPGLVKNGVALYNNDSRMAHTKLLVVDRRWTLAGSFNLNYRSFQHDLESAVVVDDVDFAGQVIERVFQPYLAISALATPDPVRWSLLRWLARPFT